MSPRLDVDNLTVGYDNRLALEQVTFSAEAGEQVAIVGPNGAGKSTLFRAILGLAPIRSGTVRFDDGDRRVGIGYLPQRSLVDWSFPVSVLDVVLMGRIRKMGWLRPYRSRDREISEHCLQQVGMQEYARRQIGELSGGQQQRTFIARALAQEASILLMDEPLSGVDLPSQEAILTILQALRAQQITVLMSTHDLALATERFERLALLNRRLIYYGPAQRAITPELLTQTYGSQAVWRGDDYVMVLGDIHCYGGDHEHLTP